MNRIKLDLGKSVTGKTWYKMNTCHRTVEAISQKYDLPIQVAEALSARGVTLENVESFLSADIKTHLPDPNILADMETMVDSLSAVIENGDAIGIFGDYDVDGATSTALLYKYLTALGIVVHFHIPDRASEGYGPNLPALHALKEKGCAIIVCVDCGTTAFDVLNTANEQGINMAVIDHHMAEPTLPSVCALVNPNRIDDISGLGHLCGAGVVFCVLVGLNRRLREKGFLVGKKPINLLSLLDLVALGTVCDVMQLKGLNRAFVRQGLKILSSRNNVGLRCLSDISGIESVPTAYHLGFVLGPRLNAGGRIGASDLATNLLLNNNLTDAMTIANKLNDLNKERQEIEEMAVFEAIQQVEQAGADYGNFICVSSKDWHSGIIGIVAGRLKEIFNKPVVAITFKDDVGKGSGRSVDGVDLGAIIVASRQLGVVESGGGHAAAAGLSILPDKLVEFCYFVNERIKKDLAGKQLEQPNIIDSVLSPEGLNVDLCKKLSQLEPFGMGNREPKFVLKDVIITSVKVLKDRHISFYIKNPLGGAGIKAICFKCVNTPLGDVLLENKNSGTISISGKARLDTWNGAEKVQFLIDDAVV